MTRRQSISLFFLSALAGSLLVTSWIPSVREVFRSTLISSERKILAKVEGEFSFNPREPYQKTQVIVLKIREGRDLLVEIYKTDSSQTQTLWADFKFENETDSYLTQGNKTSNLSLTDVKNDGIFRIIVPALDSRLTPRVHVLAYKADSNQFVRLKEQDLRGN